ncbi:MAG: TetR family transcriptional regulator [Acetobacteraceae bacterium]|nr:TetR family transcriptional regulator [Acetobacteraceae bacterium]
MDLRLVAAPDALDQRLIAAFWAEVAAHGWHGLSLGRLAAAAGVPAAELRRRCPTPLHLLGLHGRVADGAVLAGTVPGQGGLARDRVFDVLMRRIDAMQPHRAGILRLFEDVQRDPLLALLLLAALPRSMAWMLEAAEVPAPPTLVGLLRAKGLTAVWLAVVRAWARDDTADLGPTMAALDRALDRAEQVARTLRLEADA